MKRVVYNSFGVWRFYNSSGNLKMFSPITMDETSLMETDYGFSLCCDDKDNIFILCQNNKSDIWFVTINGENTEKRCMLESKTKEGYEKSFNMVDINGWINGVYTLNHEGENVIIHHIINSKSQPEIIGTAEKETPLFVCCKNENLYAFYQKGNKIVSKIYKWNDKKWTDEEVICEEENKVIYINACITNNINLVYCSEKKGKYNVVYATKGYTCELIKNSSAVVKPVGVEKEGVLHVLFEYGGRILESTGENKGEVISKPRYSYFGTFEKSDAVEINMPDCEKVYTYGFETSKGVFRPLLIKEKEIVAKPKIAEVKTESLKKENTVNPYEEILKMLDKSVEIKILTEISSRLTLLENAISKLIKEEEDENDNNTEIR